MEESTDKAALAASLEPALREVCGGRLSKVEWFRSSWQSEGAGTGYATFCADDGRERQTVVKLPVGPVEHDWTTGLGLNGTGAPAGPTPIVYASGTEIAGYDLAWVVMERFDGHPLSQELSKQSLLGFLETAADWYERARARRPVQERPPEADWAHLLSRAREMAKGAGLPDAQHWNKMIHHVQKALPRLLNIWTSRQTAFWCHGDLHPGNAMQRSREEADGRTGGDAGSANGRWVLIDLSLVHVGHWVEDAMYLERLFWGHKERLEGVKPATRLAKALKERGLQAESEDYAQLANVRRLLMAACVPVFIAREGNPRYVGEALAILERLLPLLTR
jgi:hypothetical protein